MAILSPEVEAFMEETREQIEELKQVIARLYVMVEELGSALEGEE